MQHYFKNHDGGLQAAFLNADYGDLFKHHSLGHHNLQCRAGEIVHQILWQKSLRFLNVRKIFQRVTLTNQAEHG